MERVWYGAGASRAHACVEEWHACLYLCLDVCMHAVTCKSVSTCGPDLVRLASALALRASSPPLLWLLL